MDTNAPNAQTVIKKQRKKKKSTNDSLVTWDFNPPVHFYERLVPKSEAELTNMGLELLKFCAREDSLVFGKFCTERTPPIAMSDLYKFAERCEALKKAIEIGKAMIAVRREEGAITYKYNFAAIRETQPLYDPEYKTWKLEAIKSTADNIERIVIMPQIPTPTTGEE